MSQQIRRFLLIPTVNAGSFAFILGAMWYVGMAQSNGAAYLLFFLLLAILLVSIPKTVFNLTGIQLRAESAAPVFVGQEVCLPIQLENLSKHPKRAIFVRLPGTRWSSEPMDEISGAARGAIRFPATQRGQFEISTLWMESVYPLGCFKARWTQPIQQTYLVYPRPAGNPNFPAPEGGKASENVSVQTEGDDFAGVRPFQAGESQRHIDWKAVARGHPLMVKQFAVAEGGGLHFDYDAITQGDTEARLSQLALWIINAERARRPYSLKLPSGVIAPSIGEAHFHHCLKMLACFP